MFGMAVHVIVYQHRAVALSMPGVVALAPHVAALEDDHPIARWVGAMVLYSDLVHCGEVPEPFLSSHAAALASMVLLPDEAIVPLVDLPDAHLAEHFNVPLAEIAVKRFELRAVGLITDPPGGRARAAGRRRPAWYRRGYRAGRRARRRP